MASSDSTVTGIVVETHTQSAGLLKRRRQRDKFLCHLYECFGLSNSVKLPYKRLRSRLILAAAYLSCDLFSLV